MTRTLGASATAVLGLALLASGGCVHVYQPLDGLHQPIVVDPTLRNFEGMALTVHCVPGGEGFSRMDNLALCRRVSTLFENQGAVVTTIDTAMPYDVEETPEGEVEPGSKLTLRLQSRRISKSNATLSALISSMTLTLYPAKEDEVYALDLSVRDEDGFLLVRDTFKWRLVHRYGAGVWIANRVSDWLVREEDEKLGRDKGNTGDLSLGKKSAGEEMSNHLYGQLSQVVFDAKMRRSVLHEVGPAQPVGRFAPPPPAAGGGRQPAGGGAGEGSGKPAGTNNPWERE